MRPQTVRIARDGLQVRQDLLPLRGILGAHPRPVLPRLREDLLRRDGPAPVGGLATKPLCRISRPQAA